MAEQPAPGITTFEGDDVRVIVANLREVVQGLSEGRTSAQTGKWNWVGGPPARRLDHVADLLLRAFGEVPYHVGSSMAHENFRDVDLRIIMDDDSFDALFGTGSPTHSPFWSLLCTAISEYLSRLTGLPIDFQCQRRSDVRHADWDKPRNPLGMWPEHAEPPSWHRPASTPEPAGDG